jgi:tetratricopeptide (TPR) repeat protein
VAQAHGVSEAFACLDELLHEEVLTVSGDHYRFHQEALRNIVLARLSHERKHALHAIIGRAMLELAEPEDRMARVEAGFHLLRGGKELEGAELLANTAMDFEIGTGSLQAAIPALEAARRVYIEHRRSLYELLPIVTRLATEGYYSDRRLSIAYGEEAFRLLREATGLSVADRMRPFVGKHASTFAGLAWARARFQPTPPEQRMDDFTYVFVLLINCVTTQAGVGTVCLDTEAVKRAVDFMEPLTALGKGHVTTAIHEYCTRLMQMTVECRAELRTGWRALLAQLSDLEQFKALPDYVRQLYRGGALFALGLAESWHDGDEALECARELEALGLRIYDRAASQIRMVYHVGRGELEAADMFRRRMEMHAVQTGSAWQVEVTLPLTLSVAYSTLYDVTRLKRTIEQVEQLATEIPSLVRTAKLARAALLVLRGAPQEALATYEEIFANAEPRAFAGWGRSLGHWAEALNQLGRHEEARRICERALAELSDEDRWFVRMFLGIEIQLAFADAGLGRTREASERLDALIAKHAPRGGPVTLGRLQVARATIALQLGEREAFETHLREVGRWFRPTKAPSLIARFEQLAKQGAALLGEAMQALLPPLTEAESQARTVARVQSAMSACRDRTERAHHSLRLILDHAGANAGYLFVRSGSGLQLAASEALEPPSDELTASLQSVVEDCDTETKTAIGVVNGRPTLELGAPRSSPPSVPPLSERYHTHLLWSEADGERMLVGAAAVSSNAMRPVSSAFLEAIAGVLIAPDTERREA